MKKCAVDSHRIEARIAEAVEAELEACAKAVEGIGVHSTARGIRERARATAAGVSTSTNEGAK